MRTHNKWVCEHGMKTIHIGLSPEQNKNKENAVFPQGKQIKPPGLQTKRVCKKGRYRIKENATLVFRTRSYIYIYIYIYGSVRLIRRSPAFWKKQPAKPFLTKAKLEGNLVATSRLPYMATQLTMAPSNRSQNN